MFLRWHARQLVWICENNHGSCSSEWAWKALPKKGPWRNGHVIFLWWGSITLFDWIIVLLHIFMYFLMHFIWNYSIIHFAPSFNQIQFRIKFVLDLRPASPSTVIQHLPCTTLLFMFIFRKYAKRCFELVKSAFYVHFCFWFFPMNLQFEREFVCCTSIIMGDRKHPPIWITITMKIGVSERVCVCKIDSQLTRSWTKIFPVFGFSPKFNIYEVPIVGTTVTDLWVDGIDFSCTKQTLACMHTRTHYLHAY